MARDIEEFLKIAAQRRQQQKQRAGGQQVPPPQPPPAQQPPAQKRPPVLQQPAGQKPSPRKQPSAKRPVRQSSKQSVADHVRQHLDTSNLTSRTERLGASVGLADEKMEGHLHEVFDHSVATLKQEMQSGQQTSASSSRATSQIAAELHEMLRSPTSVRQAIILSEILKRPEFD